jgi:hypothetical protein
MKESPMSEVRPALRRLLVAALSATSLWVAASVADPADIIRQVDAYRMPSQSFLADIRITPVKDGKDEAPGTYTLRGAGRNQVLVEATGFDQRGQKFLTTNAGLFFYAPHTKRAIRLTPLQTLRGQASIGDISRISFEQDYQASLLDVPVGDCPDEHCQVLELKSRDDAATYTRILLTVGQHGGQFRPLSALLYVASGKLLKKARFDKATGKLPPVTHYVDPQNPAEETRVAFDDLKPASFPASLFNPRSLEE